MRGSWNLRALRDALYGIPEVLMVPGIGTMGVRTRIQYPENTSLNNMEIPAMDDPWGFLARQLS